MRAYSYVAGAIAGIACVMPFASNALTIEELQSQIATLVARIAELQLQIAQNAAPKSSTSSSTATTTAVGSGCPVFPRTLSRGDRGTDVANLQSFLARDPSIYSGDITSFFGPLTEAALRKWQAKNGIVDGGDASSTGWGVLGNRTRAAISSQCSQVPMTVQKPVCPVLNQIVSPCVGTWNEIKDDNGCTRAWQCLSTLPSVTASSSTCPQYPTPLCASGESVVYAPSNTACRGVPVCVASPSTLNCPLRLTPQCPNGSLHWQGNDSAGCSLGHVCSSAITLTVSSPVSGQSFAKGTTLNVAWSAPSVPLGAQVRLEIYAAGSATIEGNNQNGIASALPPWGTYTWSIPVADTATSTESGIAGGIVPGQYYVLAKVYSGGTCWGSCAETSSRVIYTKATSGIFTVTR